MAMRDEELRVAAQDVVERLGDGKRPDGGGVRGREPDGGHRAGGGHGWRRMRHLRKLSSRTGRGDADASFTSVTSGIASRSPRRSP